MQKQPPLITIGITCFNAEDTIKNAIQSGFDQDYPNIELVIIDDQSTDNSVEIIKELIKDKSNARLYQHEVNTGVPGALTSAIRQAKGEFIAFIDSDDISRPDRLQKQLDRILNFEKKHKTQDIVCYSNRKVFVNGIEKPEAYVYAIGRTAPEPYGENVANFILYNDRPEPFCWGQFGCCTLMGRTQIFRDLGPFDLNFRRYSEWDIAIRLAQRGGYFIAVDEPLIDMHKTIAPYKSGKRPLIFGLQLCDKYKDYLQKQGMYHAARFRTYERFYYNKGNKIRAKLFALSADILTALARSKGAP